MSNDDGSTITPRISTRYTRRSTPKKARRVAYLDPDLAQFADSYCKAAKQSFSSLVNDLILWLKDEA